MNVWYLAAGVVLGAAFFVHLVAGNRFYSAARPAGGRAYDAWLMGRCGMQAIAADLALTATFALLLGAGAIPGDFHLECLLLAIYCSWSFLWIVSLACERAPRRCYRRLYQWALFLIVAALLGAGMHAGA